SRPAVLQSVTAMPKEPAMGTKGSLVSNGTGTLADVSVATASPPAASPLADKNDPLQVLRHDFKLENFNSGQFEVIDRLLGGRNTAAVFPTGGGKSLCYQLPSQMLPGATIVISPLIALMKDQCDALAKRGIAAARLDSSLTQQEFSDAMRGVRNGSIKLLYI